MKKRLGEKESRILKNVELEKLKIVEKRENILNEQKKVVKKHEHWCSEKKKK